MFFAKASEETVRKAVRHAGKPVDPFEMTVSMHQTVCAMLLFSQIILYATLSVAQEVGPAQWWLTLAEMLPALGLFFLMRLVLKLNPGQNLMTAFKQSLGNFFAGVITLLYAGMLLFDAWVTLHALTGVVAAYIVNNTVFRLEGMGVAICSLISVLIGGRNGVSRMVYLIRWPLAIGFVVCMVFAMRLGHAANLYPYLGPGLHRVFQSSLRYTGAIWPVVLMGFAPVKERTRMPWPKQTPSGVWLIVATIGLVAVPIFAHCFVLPYDVLQSASAWSARLVGFLRSNPVKSVWGIFLLMTMAVFLSSICGGMSVFSDIVQAGVVSKASRIWICIVFAGALFISSYFYRDGLEQIFLTLMPWRMPLAVGPLLAAAIASFVKNKRRLQKVAS